MNILEGLKNFIENKENIKIPNGIKYSGNIMNLQGEYLEEYVKNALAGITETDSNQQIALKTQSSYCYCGNKTNPPDLITSSFEAIEIKKKNSYGGTLALNSSFPKDLLHYNDTKITLALRDIFEKNKIDEMKMFYVIGFLKDKYLHNMLIISADLFCANELVYKRIIDVITEGIQQIDGVEFSKTKELGKVKKIDNLGYTDLRIRGMWNIANPLGIENIQNLTISPSTKKTNITFLISKEQYESYSNIEDFKNSINKKNILSSELLLPSPNNPANFINSIRIDFEI